MQVPLQVTFRHMEPSPTLEARIRELAKRLEKFSGRIIRCHVIVEAPHRHQHQGALYEIRVDITAAGKEIAIRRTHPADHAHEDPYVALRDAFEAARRKLQDYERELRHQVKSHDPIPRGRRRQRLSGLSN
jgi:ribosome-associated translation inhibitor RaiA